VSSAAVAAMTARHGQPGVDSAEALSGRQLLNSAWWMTGSNLVAQIFAYGSLVILARWLDPASFGTVAVGMAVVAVAALFVDRGTWGAVVVERQLSRADLIRAFWRCVGTAAVLAALMAAASGTVVDRFATGGNAAAVAVIALCLPLHGIAVVPTALLQKSMQFGRLACVTGFSNIASALFAVLLAKFGAGVWALVGRQLMLFAMVAVLSAVLCVSAFRTHERTSTSGRRNQQSRTERWFFYFMITDSVTGSLDKLIIGAFGNASLVGLYSMAVTVAMSPWKQFSAQVGQVLFAAAASEPETSYQRTNRSVQLMAMLMLPLLPVGILIAPTVLPGVLGPEWAPMVPVFQVLLVVGIGNSVINCVAEPLTGMGYMPFRTKIMVMQGLLTLLALLVLVPIGGIFGAAVALLLVFLPYATIYVTAGARRADTSAAELWRNVRPAALAMGLQLVVTSVVAVGLLACGVSGSGASCVAAVIGWSATVPMVRRNLKQARS
jgi:O-antigen/teichoic acid export membrane protein